MPVTAADDYRAFTNGLESPPRKWFAVTPSDTDELAHVCRTLVIGGAGNIVVIGADDSAAVTIAVLAGQQIGGMFKQVKSTLTTATGIVAGY